jgi:hypothetical protein
MVSVDSKKWVAMNKNTGSTVSYTRWFKNSQLVAGSRSRSWSRSRSQKLNQGYGSGKSCGSGSATLPTTAADIMAEDALPVQLTKTLTGREFLRFKGYTDTAEEKVGFLMCLSVKFLGNFCHAIAVHPTQGSVCCMP